MSINEQRNIKKVELMKSIKLFFALLAMISYNTYGQNTNLQKVDFLIGTWKMEGKEVYESWKKITNKLQGQSYQIKNGQKHVTEKLEIKLKDKVIIYTATVFDQNEGRAIPFELKSLKKELFSFENLQHDFPKKIQYKIINKNELFVSVLGENDSGFSFKLIKQID